MNLNSPTTSTTTTRLLSQKLLWVSPRLNQSNWCLWAQMKEWYTCMTSKTVSSCKPLIVYRAAALPTSVYLKTGLS